MNTRGLATVAVVLLILVAGVVLLYAARAQMSPASVAPTATATAPAPTATTSTSPSIAPAASAPSTTASGWTRGIYLQTIDPAVGFLPSNTLLISVTRALQRTEVHNEIAWISTGPWSPDGTAVVAADRSFRSYVIWPDNSLTKLEGVSAAWTWLDAGTLGAAVANRDGLELVKVDARSGQVLKRDPIGGLGWSGSTVGPAGDWVGYSTSSPDAPGQAVTASPSQTVASGPLTHPSGWLPDGRFVFTRLATVTTVEARDPAQPSGTVLGQFGSLVQALALPSSPVVVVNELRTGQISTLRGTVQRRVPLQSVFAPGDVVEGISRDGRTLTFSGGNSPVGTLTGTIDVETGVFLYMCSTGCWKLVVN